MRLASRKERFRDGQKHDTGRLPRLKRPVDVLPVDPLAPGVIIMGEHAEIDN